MNLSLFWKKKKGTEGKTIKIENSWTEIMDTVTHTHTHTKERVYLMFPRSRGKSSVEKTSLAAAYPFVDINAHL